MQGTNLSGAILDNTNLKRTLLHHAILDRASLKNSNITGAILYKASYDFWKINDIICNHIIFDWKTSNRVPQERNFVEGEFEMIYSWYPTFSYYFRDKMKALDPYIITLIVNALNEGIDDLSLHVDEINGKGFSPIIKFSVHSSSDINSIENIVKIILDNHLEDIREEISLTQHSLKQSINHSIFQAFKEANMTKLEFHGIVNNVINDNHGVINIDSFTSNQWNEIEKEINTIKEKSKSDSEFKKRILQEIKKIATGEIAKLSKKSIAWIVENASYISDHLQEIMNR